MTVTRVYSSLFKKAYLLIFAQATFRGQMSPVGAYGFCRHNRTLSGLDSSCTCRIPVKGRPNGAIPINIFAPEEAVI